VTTLRDRLERFLTRLTRRGRNTIPDWTPYEQGLGATLPVGVYRSTTDGRMLDANPAMVQMLGYPDRKTLLATRAADLYADPSVRERWIATLERAGSITDLESQVRRYDGSTIWARARARIVRPRSGGGAYLEGVIADITDRKRAEAATAKAQETLRRSARRFRALVEHSVDVTVLTGADGTVSYAGPSISRILGYSPEDVVGQSIFTFLHPDDTRRVGEVFAELLEEPGARAATEFRARHQDGSWRWMDAVAMNLLADPDVHAVVAHFWDITTRKDAEGAVRRRAADLEALHDIAQGLRQARSLDDMYDALVNRTMAVFGAVHGSLAMLSADRATFTRVCTKGVATEAAGSTFPVTGSRSGQVVETQVSFVTGDFASEVLPLAWMDPEAYRSLGPFALVPVRSEEDVLGTLAVARPRSPETRPFTASDLRLLETIAETAGTAIRRARLYADLQRHAADLAQRVSERTAALRDAKDEADRANRAKSEFLSRMSHELRTPLNAVLGFAQVLEMGSLSPDQRESVEHILKGGRHLLTLINEVLDIARIESGRLAISWEAVLLRDVVRETFDLMGPAAAEAHVALSAADVGERHVIADSQRLTQILLNLVSNAIKYGGRGGTVTLSCEDVAGGRVRIRVSDTGPGIPPEKMARLFIPFDRLGSEQTDVEGSGLGLVLSKGLTEAMGGTLGVDSTVGRGSVFWVELPAAESL
jgi:PAS domain S-box-containing protein